MNFSPEGNGPNTLFDIIDFSLQGVLSVDAEENRGNMVLPLESNPTVNGSFPSPLCTCTGFSVKMPGQSHICYEVFGWR